MSGASFIRSVINLGNSIIGVSILAMPYCFKKCGILLTVLMILLSGLVTRASCHLLLKSAIQTRRRNFESLSYHTYGQAGKFIVECGIIGFLVGVSIAFFVVIGDLGPPLAADFFVIQNNTMLRAELLIILGIFVAFPLGLLRKLESLTSLSAISMAFYAFLILKVFFEALPHLASGVWWNEVSWWQPQNFLAALPIVSLALSCQTQLFEFFDTTVDSSLKRMDQVVMGAVNLCSLVYISVGFFGYIAFYDQPITGNILVKFPQSFITDLFKLGFITTVVISFPLCLFPCRTSLHSLLFKPSSKVPYELNPNHIPDGRFRNLTIFIVAVTIITAILVPNIELVLGMIGSTIGTTICFILPSMIFIHLTDKHTSERRLAQLILCIGIFILIACTYITLNEANKPMLPSTPAPFKIDVLEKPGNSDQLVASSSPSLQLPKIPEDINKKTLLEDSAQDIIKLKPKEDPIVIPVKKESEVDEPLHPDALKKEDKELKPIEKQQQEKLDKQEVLLKQLQEQQEEQKKILAEQKKVLEELQKHKETHDENLIQKPPSPVDVNAQQPVAGNLPPNAPSISIEIKYTTEQIGLNKNSLPVDNLNLVPKKILPRVLEEKDPNQIKIDSIRIEKPIRILKNKTIQKINSFSNSNKAKPLPLNNQQNVPKPPPPASLLAESVSTQKSIRIEPDVKVKEVPVPVVKEENNIPPKDIIAPLEEGKDKQFVQETKENIPPIAVVKNISSILGVTNIVDKLSADTNLNQIPQETIKAKIINEKTGPHKELEMAPPLTSQDVRNDEMKRL